MSKAGNKLTSGIRKVKGQPTPVIPAGRKAEAPTAADRKPTAAAPAKPAAPAGSTHPERVWPD